MSVVKIEFFALMLLHSATNGECKFVLSFKALRICAEVLILRNLVDPASSHMLVSKIKPCMSQNKFYTANLRMAH